MKVERRKKIVLQYQSKPVSRGLKGTVQVPGDKSISHRALMLSAIADGNSYLQGLLLGEDNLHTMQVLQALGVKITPKDALQQHWEVQGVGLHGLKATDVALDFGNSGTGMRLMAGLLAGQAFPSTLIGDTSLSTRPMRRIIEPLRQMGAHIEGTARDTAPLKIAPAQLTAIDYHSQVASAQVKSCILLAGLYAKGQTTVHELSLSRDHTERMLSQMGVAIGSEDLTVTLTPPKRLVPLNLHVPGDFSSAAFFIVAATLVPGSVVTLTHVGVNPSRLGLLHILRAMGADIDVQETTVPGAREPTATITVKASPLSGIDIPTRFVASAIDEFPIIFVAASLAKGRTSVTGVRELTVKESNRLAAMATALQTVGVVCECTDDSMVIDGGQMHGGEVDAKGDHRIAMAMLVAGSVAHAPIIVNDCANIITSFPHFIQLANQLGLDLGAV